MPMESGETELQIQCLVCSAPIASLYLGVEACRACGEFFRRSAAKGKQFVCRQGTDNCDVVKKSQYLCKSCRYAKCVQAGFSVDWIEGDQRKSTKMQEFNKIDEAVASTSHQDPTVGNAEAIPAPDLPLIRRIEHNYRLMSAVRRTSELAHPDSLAKDNPLFGGNTPSQRYTTATYSQIDEGTRIAIVALFEFANETFEGFRELSDGDKLNSIRSSNYPIFVCECFRKTLEEFPNKPDFFVVSATHYMRLSDWRCFFTHEPNPACRKEAEELVESRMYRGQRMMLPLVSDAGMDNTEFFAYVGLCFWCLSNSAGCFSDQVYEMADDFRARLFRELHLYYKSRGMHDYAIRIGKMMILLSTFQETTATALEERELYRLLDLVQEDSFAYQFHNDE